jgi:glycosyltransferase involved in cell wall biosynthesis
MRQMRQHVCCSLVVPLYNERETLLRLYAGIRDAMEAVGESFECILVDDGSSDGSLADLREIAQVDSRVVVVALRQNSGKSAALRAGFSVACGDFIVTMDGDLQHDPADIPRFLEKLKEGFDVVCGWRLHRTESWLRQIATRCANWVLAWCTGVRIRDFGSGFKAYRCDYVKGLPVYGELPWLIPALAMRRGAGICEIPITTLQRRYGRSKYSIVRKLPVFFDLLTVSFLRRYIPRPLHFFGTAGIGAILIGGTLGVWMLLGNLLYGMQVMPEHGPLLIFASLLILGGVQLLTVGLLGEMQVRHYFQITGRGSPYEVESVIPAAIKDETFSEGSSPR